MKIKTKPTKPERNLNIEQHVTSLYDTDFAGTVDEVAKKLQDLKESYPQYRDLTIKVESGWDDSSMALVGFYDEPEKDYLARLDRYNTKLAEYEQWFVANKDQIEETLTKRKDKAEAAKQAQIARLERELRKLRKA